MVRSVDQPEGLLATAEGNAQTTRNGDLFVGWGTLPYISEFSPSRQLLFNADLLAGLTYRAYRLPWHPAGKAVGPRDAAGLGSARGAARRDVPAAENHRSAAMRGRR